MLAALSRVDVLAGYATLSSSGREGSAISGESKVVRRAVADVMHSAEQSQSLFGSKAVAISQVWALVNECAEPGWDGADAEAVNLLAAFAAQDFVRTLPAGVPPPEVVADPDGAISLDWIHSRNRSFSVSVGVGARLAYAWLDGSDRGHGVARFDGERIPSRILDGIGEIVKHGNAALGPR